MDIDNTIGQIDDKLRAIDGNLISSDVTDYKDVVIENHFKSVQDANIDDEVLQILTKIKNNDYVSN